MTRLREADLEPIPRRLHDYDARLREITGASLRKLACRAAGIREADIIQLLDRVRFAAVPIGSGLGVIHGFSHAVAAIVTHLGFEAAVTREADADGMAEGAGGGADILMLADDRRYVAMTPEGGVLADNTAATARGFVAGLELMSGTLAGGSVLVLGCGPLGAGAARLMLEQDARVALCDVREERVREVVQELGPASRDRILVEGDRETAIGRYRLIFDATDTGGFIEARHLTAESRVAAPGMPCGLTPEAMERHRDRVIHDPLEIGTATMAVQAAVLAARGDTGEKPRKAGDR